MAQYIGELLQEKKSIKDGVMKIILAMQHLIAMIWCNGFSTNFNWP